VLCNDVWVVKVVDLGSARVFTQGEKFYGSVGAHEYMAPEIFFKNGYEGPPADVWSLGILVSKLLVGPGFYRPEIKVSIVYNDVMPCHHYYAQSCFLGQLADLIISFDVLRSVRLSVRLSTIFIFLSPPRRLSRLSSNLT